MSIVLSNRLLATMMQAGTWKELNIEVWSFWLPLGTWNHVFWIIHVNLPGYYRYHMEEKLDAHIVSLGESSLSS